MFIDTFLTNVLHPPVLFFLLGMLAVFCKSDLEIPQQIGKFLSLYLLFDIGIKGGEELFHSGITPTVLKVVAVCIVFSFVIPFGAYKLLRRKLNTADSAAIAATYGSISAVTFATAVSYLESLHVAFGGYMVAGMALMESPAIVAGLILYNVAKAKEKAVTVPADGEGKPEGVQKLYSKRTILHEALFNGSVFLLVGSLVIGALCGSTGEAELAPFVGGIFKGMLSLYMLDMGLIAAKRFKDLKQSGVFLGGFALGYPLIAAVVGIGVSYLLALSPGDSLLMTVLLASASYVAVPAAMRNSIPEANMSLLLPMALGITFTFNVVFGIPTYFYLINLLHGSVH
jgi:uncharacterized protein